MKNYSCLYHKDHRSGSRQTRLRYRIISLLIAQESLNVVSWVSGHNSRPNVGRRAAGTETALLQAYEKGWGRRGLWRVRQC